MLSKQSRQTIHINFYMSTSESRKIKDSWWLETYFRISLGCSFAITHSLSVIEAEDVWQHILTQKLNKCFPRFDCIFYRILANGVDLRTKLICRQYRILKQGNAIQFLRGYVPLNASEWTADLESCSSFFYLKKSLEEFVFSPSRNWQIHPNGDLRNLLYKSEFGPMRKGYHWPEIQFYPLPDPNKNLATARIITPHKSYDAFLGVYLHNECFLNNKKFKSVPHLVKAMKDKIRPFLQ